MVKSWGLAPVRQVKVSSKHGDTTPLSDLHSQIEAKSLVCRHVWRAPPEAGSKVIYTADCLGELLMDCSQTLWSNPLFAVPVLQ